jgi:small GTP-binding protein
LDKAHPIRRASLRRGILGLIPRLPVLPILNPGALHKKCILKKFDVVSDLSCQNPRQMSDTPLIRIIVIGDTAVGKTQMMFRFTDDTFTAQGVQTIGVDFKAKLVNLNGIPHKIQIWDTAGQERFRNITEAYYRKGHGIILVYDVSARQTFDNIPGWFDSIKAKCEGLGPIPIVLVGNKADLEPAVPMEEGFQIATDHGAKFFQTSAKDGSNIEDAFMECASAAAAAIANKQAGDRPSTGVELGQKAEGAQPKKKGFC